MKPASVSWVIAPLSLLALSFTGCAYQHRETVMHAAPLNLVKSSDYPDGMWSFHLVSAELPEFKGEGLPWDSDGTGPDPFVRLIINRRIVWESPTIENNRMPKWDVVLPRNVEIEHDDELRIELWDRDSAVTADPAGALAHRGLPEVAMPDAQARLILDNLGVVVVTVSAPRAHQGVGLRFEVRPDELMILEVDRYSPAARAGILKGERIVAIGSSKVSELSGDEASSRLSLAYDRGSPMTVEGSDGKQRQVTLDKGFIWLVM
jgi:C2 domain